MITKSIVLHNAREALSLIAQYTTEEKNTAFSNLRQLYSLCKNKKNIKEEFEELVDFVQSVGMSIKYKTTTSAIEEMILENFTCFYGGDDED